MAYLLFMQITFVFHSPPTKSRITTEAQKQPNTAGMYEMVPMVVRLLVEESFNILYIQLS